MKKIKIAAAAIALLVLLSVFIGCSTSRGYDDPVVTGRASGRIYVSNSLDDTVDVIDARNNTRIGGSPFEAGRFPAGMTLDTAEGRLYVANYIGKSITVYNTTNMQQITGSPFAMNDGPYGLYLDGAADRLYAVCPDAGLMYVFDTNTMTQTAGSPVTVGTAAYTVTGNPAQGHIIVANSGDANFMVFAKSNLAQITGSPFASSIGAFGLALDNQANRLYVTGADVRIYTANSYAELSGSPLNTRGSSNKGVAFKPGENRLWVAVSDEGMISLFNIDEMSEVNASPYYIGGEPEGLAINSDENLLYSADSTGNTVRIFSANMMEATDSPLTVGNGPRTIILDPDFNK